VPTAEPTETPTLVPTAEPTESPTLVPTAEPTETPTLVPTAEPTGIPTDVPTSGPTTRLSHLARYRSTISAETTQAIFGGLVLAMVIAMIGIVLWCRSHTRKDWHAVDESLLKEVNDSEEEEEVAFERGTV